MITVACCSITQMDSGTKRWSGSGWRTFSATLSEHRVSHTPSYLVEAKRFVHAKLLFLCIEASQTLCFLTQAGLVISLYNKLYVYSIFVALYTSSHKTLLILTFWNLLKPFVLHFLGGHNNITCSIQFIEYMFIKCFILFTCQGHQLITFPW